jgi:hypothetical protein
MGQRFSVYHQAADTAFSRKAQKQMPHQAGVGAFIIGGDGIVHHPLPDGPTHPRRRLRLEQAVGHIYHIVTPRMEEADPWPGFAGGNGKLHLISITFRIFCAKYFGNGQIRTANAAESVFYPMALGGQLRLIGHVPVLAAAAPGIIRAIGCTAVRRGFQHLLQTGPGSRSAHFHQLYPADFTGQGAFHKDYLPIKMGNALASGADALYGEDYVFFLFHFCKS